MATKTRRKKTETEELKEILKPEPEKEIDFKKTLSTGSTLLDLVISGGKRYDGGVPGGIIMEIFGPPSSGKTAILAELAGSCQTNGGEARFDDPEARFDGEYSRIYGFELDKKLYFRPDTVKEMFDGLLAWEPKDPSVINVSCEDSLAALSTEMEMTAEDKMGMKRAKDFSEGTRKTARIIAKNNWLIACSNQLKHGGTPGGEAIKFHSSLRIVAKPEYPVSKIDKTLTVKNNKIKKVIGITSRLRVVKSTVDDPFRECRVSIVFGYGIDDIRENLIYIKTHTGANKFLVKNDEWAQIDKAIEKVEELDWEEQLRQNTIELWHEIQEKMKVTRKSKVRR